MKKSVKTKEKRWMVLLYYLAWAIGIIAALFLIYGIITSLF